MTRNPNAIYLTEGEQVAYIVTVKRDGSAVDLSSTSVTFWVHDDQAAFGTNKVDGAATSWVTDGSDGKISFTFTTAYTSFATDRDFEGKWAMKITTGGGTTVEWTKQEPLFVVRNPFVAEGS